MKTADCVPILLGDPVSGAFAAVHAGWRGTLAGAVVVGVERLAKEYDARPDNLRVAIGASAGPCCYEVGSEVIEAFTKQFADGEKLFTETRPGHAMVDLLKANRDQLESAECCRSEFTSRRFARCVARISSFLTGKKRACMEKLDG